MKNKTKVEVADDIIKNGLYYNFQGGKPLYDCYNPFDILDIFGGKFFDELNQRIIEHFKSVLE